MCAGNVQCKDCAQKQAQMGYANDFFEQIGLGNLVGEQGIQAHVNVKVEVPNHLWVRMGVMIIAVILVGSIAYFGVKKLLT